MTPAEAKRFVEEARARADKLALERHANKRVSSNKQLVPVVEPKEEKQSND